MAFTGRYGPSGQDIVSEEIDGEVIIVNLSNGNYYSLTQSATAVWAGIQECVALVQIQDRLHQRYSGETATMDRDFVELIQALETEQLITHVSASASNPGANVSPVRDLSEDGKEEYLPPIFERFTDMGDLLLLDPVHETEAEKGWPHAKGNA